MDQKKLLDFKIACQKYQNNYRAHFNSQCRQYLGLFMTLIPRLL